MFVTDEVRSRVARLQLPFNDDGYDKYGTSQRHLEQFFAIVTPLYRRYFQVRAHGVENVPATGRAMIVGNHSGGYAIDGLMTVASMFLEGEPPRLVQGMAEKFLAALPFSSTLSSRLGHLPGIPEHAERLLADDRMLMVFPEGARGTAKLYRERHSLIRFGTGFMRLAMKMKTPIIPMAFLGGGDAVPSMVNLYQLGRLVGVPYIPVTPYGLALPLPRACAIHYGAPMNFIGSGDEDDDTIEHNVQQVVAVIRTLMDEGRPAHERRLKPLNALMSMLLRNP
jgi:1-acyl-sn-glycerol-3-phosphate acyltransferase